MNVLGCSSVDWRELQQLKISYVTDKKVDARLIAFIKIPTEFSKTNMINQGIRLPPFQRSAPWAGLKNRPGHAGIELLLFSQKRTRLRDNVTAFLVGNARLEPNTSCWVENFMHRYCARMPTLTRTSTRSNTFPRCFQRWLTAHPIRGNGPRSVPGATIKRLEASQTQTPVSDQILQSH